MKTMTEILLILDQSTAYLEACWALPWAAPACVPLWYWVASASMVAGVLLLLWSAWRVVNYYRMLRVALRAQEARDAMPDEETLQKHRWVGEDSDAPDPAFASKIREEIERRRLTEKGLVPPAPKT